MDDFDTASAPEISQPARARFIPELGIEDGMYALMGYMSLWELAHRWVGADPMTPMGSPIALAAQPPLRALCHAVGTGEVQATHLTVADMDDRDPNDPFYGALFGSGCIEPITSDDVFRLMSCNPDRQFLDGIYVALDHVFYWLTRKEISVPFPDFVIPPWSLKPPEQGSDDSSPATSMRGEPPKRRPQAELLDKAASQGAAITLWAIYPDMRISHVAEHAAYLRAGAANYCEKARREWAAEVAPPHIKGRKGRTAKVQPIRPETPRQSPKSSFSHLRAFFRFWMARTLQPTPSNNVELQPCKTNYSPPNKPRPTWA